MPTVLDTEVDTGEVDVGSDQALTDLASDHELLRRRAEGLLLQSLIRIDRRGLTKLAQQVPEVVDRLLAGRLGVAQAHLLGRLFRAPRVGRHVPEFIDSFFQYATEMSYHQFEHYCRSWRLLMDQDGTLPNPAGRATGGASTVVNIVADLPTWLHQLDRISGIPGAAPQFEPFGPARGRAVSHLPARRNSTTSSHTAGAAPPRLSTVGRRATPTTPGAPPLVPAPFSATTVSGSPNTLMAPASLRPTDRLAAQH